MEWKYYRSERFWITDYNVRHLYTSDEHCRFVHFVQCVLYTSDERCRFIHFVQCVLYTSDELCRFIHFVQCVLYTSDERCRFIHFVQCVLCIPNTSLIRNLPKLHSKFVFHPPCIFIHLTVLTSSLHCYIVKTVSVEYIKQQWMRCLLISTCIFCVDRLKLTGTSLSDLIFF